MMMPDKYEILNIMEAYHMAKENKINTEEEIENLFSDAMKILFTQGYGMIYTIDDFLSCVDSGFFIDYDGIGKFCRRDGTIGPIISCNIKWLSQNRSDYDFVIWYNK